MRLTIQVLAAAVLCLAACESERPATRAGAALDRAGTQTGQAVERAAKASGGAIERAGGWVREKTD